jgi:hypothetical protein
VIYSRHRPGDAESSILPPGSLSILGLVLLVLLTGCTGLSGQAPVAESSPTSETTTADHPDPEHRTTVGTASPTTESPERRTKAGPPELGSDLYGLTQAENRTAYARDHGLELRNDSVFVTIELREGRDVPDDVDANVTARVRSQVDAYVPIQQLEALARHENTTSVSPPERPQPHDAAGAVRRH